MCLLCFVDDLNVVCYYFVRFDDDYDDDDDDDDNDDYMYLAR